jgi:GTP-binding protein HflX
MSLSGLSPDNPCDGYGWIHASLKSTLEEIKVADLILNVLDISNPRVQEHVEITSEILKDIGCGDIPTILVFNKLDNVKHPIMPKLIAKKYENSIAISAHDTEDVQRLRNKVIEHFDNTMVELETTIPYSKNKLIARVQQVSHILESKYDEDGVWFKLRTPRAFGERIKLLSTHEPESWEL